MDSEATIIIAFLFKRSGKNELKESEIYLPLSIELRWLSSPQAHNFVRYALKQKLLVKKGEIITPNFDIEKINIPIGFYPSKTSFETEKDSKTKGEWENILDTIIQLIIEKTNQDEKNIIAKIKEIEDEKGILPEIAALIIARDNDIDIRDFFENVENKIFKENEE